MLEITKNTFRLHAEAPQLPLIDVLHLIDERIKLFLDLYGKERFGIEEDMTTDDAIFAMRFKIFHHMQEEDTSLELNMEMGVQHIPALIKGALEIMIDGTVTQN